MRRDAVDFAPSGRARTPDGLRSLLGDFMSEKSLERGLAFAPRMSDVLIATYPKCGTTLMQQIVHGLRTGGDLDFRDISEVVPWLEVAFDLGQDPAAEQRANPRVFKTHLDWEALPKGGRVIYVLREPIAALVSFYHFFSGWLFEPGSMDLESFALDYVLGREGRQDYWRHLVSWWPHRSDARVLALCYEDLVEDLPGAVRTVAEFIGVDADPARYDVATRQARKEFMQQYPTLWEDPRLREARNPVLGLPPDAKGTKVRGSADALGRIEGAGAEGSGRLEEVTEAVREAWAGRWEEVVAPRTGCDDYRALRRRLMEVAKAPSDGW